MVMGIKLIFIAGRGAAINFLLLLVSFVQGIAALSSRIVNYVIHLHNVIFK